MNEPPRRFTNREWQILDALKEGPKTAEDLAKLMTGRTGYKAQGLARVWVSHLRAKGVPVLRSHGATYVLACETHQYACVCCGNPMSHPALSH